MDTPSAGGPAGRSILGRWRVVRCAARCARCCGPWCRSSGRNAIGWPADRRRPALRRVSQWRQLSPAELAWCPWIPAARPAERARGESAGRVGRVYLRGHLRAIRTSRSLADSAGGNRTPRPVAPGVIAPPPNSPQSVKPPRHPHAGPQDHKVWPGRSPHPPTSPPTSAGSPSPSRYLRRVGALQPAPITRPGSSFAAARRVARPPAQMPGRRRAACGGSNARASAGEAVRLSGKQRSKCQVRGPLRLGHADHDESSVVAGSGPSEEVTKARMGLLDEEQTSGAEQTQAASRTRRSRTLATAGTASTCRHRRPRPLQNVTLL